MDNNYQRLFYIFKNMDNDVGRPTGFIKAEINNETAKLQILLNNLVIKRGMTYHLYGIRKVDNQLRYTDICDIPGINGRADIKINTVSSNIKEINIYAVIARFADRVSPVICPVVAYTKNEVEWKREFGELLAKEAEQKLNAGTAMDKPTEAEGRFPIAAKSAVNTAAESTEAVEIEIPAENTPDILPDREFIEQIWTNEQAQDNISAENPAEAEAYDISAQENKPLVQVETENKAEAEADKEDRQAEPVIENNNEAQQELMDINGSEFNLSSRFQEAITSIYNIDKADSTDNIAVNQESILSDEITGDEDIQMFDPTKTDDVWMKIQKDFDDISSIEAETKDEKRKNEIDIPGLKEELDKNFEGYNPFKARSKSFMWWKINSPGFLNNILFRNNIKTYLLFNPKVMLAHYKYRYIILGIRNDRRSGREQLICGIPGVYSIDENPFGNMGSWAQLQGYKPKYGAFGYWMVIIDPRTGRLIKIK